MQRPSAGGLEKDGIDVRYVADIRAAVGRSRVLLREFGVRVHADQESPPGESPERDSPRGPRARRRAMTISRLKCGLTRRSSVY
jgi:hypothetical protein